MGKEQLKKIKGVIFDVQNYSLHDGEGIRTLVFMKGCPLRCIWCSNPESQNFNIEIGSLVKNCIRCGKCLEVCEENAICLPDFQIIRDRCNNCLKCAKACRVKAKKIIGIEITVDELIDIVEQDRIFYKNSGGGVTVGGGEPVGQSDFVSAFLYTCKTRNINTSIETCGYASKEVFEKTVEYTDVILFDIKHMDSKKHRELTGVRNEIILENAKRAGKYKDIIIRTPIIPGLNDDLVNIMETIRFASSLPKLVRMELLPYHNLGESKYDWIGKEYFLKNKKTYNTKEGREELRNRLNEIGHDIPIIIV